MGGVVWTGMGQCVGLQQLNGMSDGWGGLGGCWGRVGEWRVC